MVAFEEHFWGDKYSGFDVLLQNFKLGANASKELGEFVKERSSIEETYSKSLLKLSNKCSSAYNHIGSFEPCWKFLQSTTEKLANSHVKVIQTLNDVAKVVKEYGELQKEKHKQLKDEFSATAEVVQNMQTLSNAVIKAREGYQQKCSDVDRCRKDSNNIKEIEKTEHKLKKVCEEYKSLIEKRELTRKEFGDRMVTIAKKFQSLEEEHLQRMCDILKMYGSSLTTDRHLLNGVIEEFERNMMNFTIDSLLQQFVYGRQTGKVIPPAIVFEEIALQVPPVDVEALAGREEEKKKKKKEKRERKERRLIRRKPKATENGGALPEADVAPEPQVEVDDEGYSIRPPDSESIGRESRDSLSYDSETESDDEPRKIQITIKPKHESATNAVASVEELRALGAQLTLASPSSVKKFSSSDDRKFGGSQTSIDMSSKLSNSNGTLLDLNVNSPGSESETASIRSDKSNTSLDALHNQTNNTSGTIPSSSTSGDKLFDDNFFDSLPKMQSQEFMGSSPSLNGKPNSDGKVVDEKPPPLPVKRRSWSTHSHLNAFDVPIEITDNNGEQETKEAVISPSGSLNAFPQVNAEEAKQKSKTYQLPVLAPPSNPRRQSASARKSYRPTSTSCNTPTTLNDSSQPQKSAGAASSSPGPSSFLKELEDINFTPSWPPATTVTTPAISTTPAETTNTPWVSVESGARGNKQASGTSSPPIGTSERVTPIAVAFIETVNAYFKGPDQTKYLLKITGDMTVSFPASIIPVLIGENPPLLSFAVNGTSSLEQIFPNKALVDREGQVVGGNAIHFKFNVKALGAYLKKQSAQSSTVSYYNVDILKYQVRTEGLNSIPLHLSAHWRCYEAHTDLKIDYKYNSSCMASQVPLNAVTVVVPVDGGVEIMQSKPSATWSGEHQRALWKIPQFPPQIDGLNRDSGSLRARFDVSKGPSTPATVAIQFSGENTIFSSLNFEVKSPSLKLTLVKKRFASGKYMVDP